MGAEPIDPVVAEVVVAAEQTAAFVAFTAEMGQWWDPLLTPDPATFSGIDVDPHGEVRMVCGDEKFAFAEVETWEPDHEFVLDFWLGHNPPPTRVAVSFTPDGDGTRVRLEHSGFPDAATRDKYVHWDDQMARYAAHATR